MNMETQQTAKQKIIELLHRLPDDIDYDRALESILVLRRIEIGIEQGSGQGIEHEEFMRELLAEDEDLSGDLDATGTAGSKIH
jgi:hypothetical protein